MDKAEFTNYLQCWNNNHFYPFIIYLNAVYSKFLKFFILEKPDAEGTPKYEGDFTYISN